jgi:NAD(P)-dependent dehydrogenase (short-subunit alcohol dehydrogenase family)
MAIQNETVLITGSNRGIGRAFVEAFLAHGAKRVYVAARRRADLDSVVALDRARVVPIVLDVVKPEQIHSAAETARDVTVLVNNAGVLSSGHLLEAPMEVFRRDMEVNYFGMLEMTRAMGPVIARNGGGTVVNLLSVVSLTSFPGVAGYCASKAAAWSATQAMRADLAKQKIRVLSVFPGPIDTDMAKDVPLEKTRPIEVANEVIGAIIDGREDVFPDPMSKQVYANWKADHKAIERQFAAF